MDGAVKLCECGCGKPAPIAKITSRRSGYKKGDPMRFIRGHGSRGKNNPKWSGGRITKQSGSIMVMRPDHPNANKDGYIFEHILVAERSLLKLLPPGAKIHHVNGDNSDNMPKNLVICQDHAYHMLIHKRTRALTQCGNQHWLKCPYCGEYEDPENLYVSPSGKNHYHRKCSARYYRERRAQSVA